MNDDAKCRNLDFVAVRAAFDSVGGPLVYFLRPRIADAALKHHRPPTFSFGVEPTGLQATYVARTVARGALVGVEVQDLPVILVIEDDHAIQAMIEDVLSEGGFEPAIAASGEEAVTLLRGNRGKYRALVTDIALLGRLDGWEVAKQAREIEAGFPVIYITGASAEQWSSHGVPNSILIEKPFAPPQLVTAISQLLNAASSRAPS